MTKILKVLLITILAFVGAFIVPTLFINNTIHKKITAFLENRLPETITQSYSNMDVDTFSGTVTLSDVVVTLKNKSDTLTHTIVRLEHLIIEKVSYWDYLFNDEIHIEDIKLKKPTITYYKDKVVLNKDTMRKAPIKLYKPIVIDELSIDNTTLTIIEKDKDSVLLYTKNTTVEIDDIFISQQTLLNKIPLKYSRYEATSDSIFLKISPYENLTVENLKIKDRQVLLNNILLQTKYSKKELSNIITKERDHINLSINAVDVQQVDFGFNNNNTLFVHSPKIDIVDPVVTIYRDKLVADDTSLKNLYSKMLREAKIALTINEVALKNGQVTYTERVKEDNSGGSIYFSNMDATLANVSNTYKAPVKTNIDIQATFMKKTPIKVQWEFDVNNVNDLYIFKAEIDALAANDLNTFMEPNLKVRLEGMTHKTYFTISGGNHTSHIDMRMHYEDFKVNILNKNGNKKNKIFSAIANIFIKKNSESDSDRFRNGSGNATRDKTKSFFNYLWLNIRAGLLDMLTGNGKK